MNGSLLGEGWFLMSDHDVEIELARLRGEEREGSTASPLTVEEALAFRSSGNIPDDLGRSLRLVLSDATTSFEQRRLAFEPDLHSAPTWRREGSRSVTVIPLPREKEVKPDDWRWSDDPSMRELEEEWERSGRVGDLVIPGALRGFLFKTIAALRVGGQPVTIDSVCASIARWLSPSDVERIRAALIDAGSQEAE